MKNFYQLRVTGLVITIILFALSISHVYGANVKQSLIKSNYKYVPGQIIVKFKPAVGNVESSSISADIFRTCQVEKTWQMFPNQKYKSTPKKKVIDLSRIYKLLVAEDTDIEAVCAQLSKNPNVEYAEPNYILHVEEEPNDPDYPKQFHLPQIHMPEAWDLAKGNRSVIIAIVDTGIDWDHPDLADNIWTNAGEIGFDSHANLKKSNGIDDDGNGFVDDYMGWDWVEGLTDVADGEDGEIADNNPMDFDGHGTFCSGLVAAVTNNEIGVAGVTWYCKIMPLRVGWLPAEGQGLIRMDWVANAFIYAADNGANVINLSTGSTQAVADAAQYAFENGVVLCNSAGNDNNEEADPMQLEPYSLVVAAVDTQDFKASYSSYGEWVTVSAPGGDLNRGKPGIRSTDFDDTYGSYQGTSFSSPIVAGVAGLLKSYNPEWTNFDIMARIVETADYIDDINPDYAGKLGSGRVNAYRALTETVFPKPKIRLLTFAVDDSSNGNGNGVLDAGETINISVTLENTWADASNLTGTLMIDDWAVEVIKNTANFPALPGINDPEHRIGDNSLDPFVIQIDSAALPHNVPVKVLVQDDSGLSKEVEFVLGINSSILVVDDDHLGGNEEDNDVEGYYISALDSMGYAFDYWDHERYGTPMGMSSYSTVIWLCEWAFPSLDSLDRVELSNYLDSGGHLFLSGQDIGWDLNAEAAPGLAENQFVSSGGASKVFYDNYLHASYLADDSEYSSLEGVAGDPISDGLIFNVYQPGREADEQFPSEIEAINDGVSIFYYPNGLAGGVRYEGDYRAVYFAFGGYEAIVQDEARAKLLPRVLNWLNGITVVHEPLDDTEDTVNDYKVVADIGSEGEEITNVDLYWDIDGEMPFNKVPMIDEGDGHYTAMIPAQTDITVTYTLFVKAASGYTAALKFYSFKVGSDFQAPEFTEVTGLSNTIDKNGPYRLRVLVKDNLGVDTSSVYLHYGKIGAPEDSIRLSPDQGLNQFSVDVPGGFAYGDSVYYYLTAVDVAVSRNHAVSQVDTILIGLEDFETGLDNWQVTPGTWGLDSTDQHSGLYSMNDSPGGSLVPNVNASITLRKGLDLSTTDYAALYVWSHHFLRPAKDFGYIEVSTDSGATWEQLGDAFVRIKSRWYEEIIPLGAYCGAGFDDVRLRFRLETDAADNPSFTGWFLDDIKIREDVAVEVAETDIEINIPDEFRLEQNFPNPFNPATQIGFDIAKAGRVKLEIYNLLGQRIRTLIDNNVGAGSHVVRWEGANDFGEPVSSGVYLYRLEADGGRFVQSCKLLLMR